MTTAVLDREHGMIMQLLEAKCKMIEGINQDKLKGDVSIEAERASFLYLDDFFTKVLVKVTEVEDVYGNKRYLIIINSKILGADFVKSAREMFLNVPNLLNLVIFQSYNGNIK